jgi:hypothetical protein
VGKKPIVRGDRKFCYPRTGTARPIGLNVEPLAPRQTRRPNKNRSHMNPTYRCVDSSFVRLALHIGHRHMRKFLCCGLTSARYISVPSDGQLTRGAMSRKILSFIPVVMKYPCVPL